MTFFHFFFFILQNLFPLYCSCTKIMSLQLYKSVLWALECKKNSKTRHLVVGVLRSIPSERSKRRPPLLLLAAPPTWQIWMTAVSVLGFHAAAIFAQAGAAGTGRPFDIHLTSKCLLSRSLLSSLLVSPPSVTRPFILRHDLWPERFCCSTYLPFSVSPTLTHIREMTCLLFIIKKKKKEGGIKWSAFCLRKLSSSSHFSQCSSDDTSASLPPPSKKCFQFL